MQGYLSYLGHDTPYCPSDFPEPYPDIDLDSRITIRQSAINVFRISLDQVPKSCDNIQLQESIPIGRVPLAWNLHMLQFQWPPPGVTLGVPK